MSATWLQLSFVLWSICKFLHSYWALLVSYTKSRAKIAIKMSRASGKNKEGVKKDAGVSSGSEDDDEAIEDGGREETPDVYRHSALGIYAGVSIIYLSIVKPWLIFLH